MVLYCSFIRQDWGNEGALAWSFIGRGHKLALAEAPCALLHPLDRFPPCTRHPQRLRPWRLAYSTARHGTSLATLYRRAGSTAVPTLLLVRDGSGHVFGCYTTDSWRVAPRYFGSGETFVFQLQVRLWGAGLRGGRRGVATAG